ncbi:hypothetical protein BpHYR1_027092, partial [Brachionus plicatilis]
KFNISQVKFDYSLKRDNSLIVKADELILSDFRMIDSLSAYRIELDSFYYLRPHLIQKETILSTALWRIFFILFLDLLVYQI